MLEKMADFFENRLDGYDEHMMTNIEAADEFYPFTAKQLPTTENCHTICFRDFSNSGTKERKINKIPKILWRIMGSFRKISPYKEGIVTPPIT